MNSRTLGLRVSGAVFALISLVHLMRVLTQTGITVAQWTVPIWYSLPPAVVTALLAAWLWRLSGTRSHPEAHEHI